VWFQPPRGEGRPFLSAELKGFKGRLLKGPQKGPGPAEVPPPQSPSLALRLFREENEEKGGKGRATRGSESASGGRPEMTARVGGAVVSAGELSRGRGWRGQDRVKGGASPTNTRTHSLLRPSHTRFSGT
jgi:hypothetical protein